MARRATIDDAELLLKLSSVFRDVGYEGASLASLSEATGLKKASLYHRFPEGKEQMAREVLGAAEAWLTEHILCPLKEPAPPADRIKVMTRRLNEFYSGGRQACLLNMLSSSHIHEGPFAEHVRHIFEAWISGFVEVVVDAGFDRRTARARAERAVALLQGSLVLSRGMGTTKHFRDCLSGISEVLIG